MTTENHRSEVGFLNCRRPRGPALSGIHRCPLHTGLHLVSQRPILAHGLINDLSSVLTGSVLTGSCSIVSDSKIALSRSSSPICGPSVRCNATMGSPALSSFGSARGFVMSPPCRALLHRGRTAASSAANS